MKSNKRNKKKVSKVEKVINFELLQDELVKNNKYRHKPNHKPNKRNKRGADRK